jgi:hypothetical protein
MNGDPDPFGYRFRASTRFCGNQSRRASCRDGDPLSALTADLEGLGLGLYGWLPRRTRQIQGSISNRAEGTLNG